MKRMFIAYVTGITALWGFSTVRGVELFSSKRGFMSKQVRQSGGYRSYTYWRGGK